MDANKAFMLRRGELEGRWDSSFNLAICETKIISKYNMIPLSNVVKMLGGGTPSKSNPDFWRGDIPWASPKDFGTFYLADTEDHISDTAIKQSATQLIPKNSVLVVFRSGVLIHSLPVAVTTREMAINQDLKALIPTPEAQSEYLAIFFQVFSQKLLRLITKHGTTVQSINTEQFTNLLIPIPPKEVQSEIVRRYINALEVKDKKEAEARTLIESIDDYVLSELGITLPEERREMVFRVAFSRVRGGRFDPFFSKNIFTDMEKALQQGSFSVVLFGSIMQGIQNGMELREYTSDGVRYLRVTDLSPSGIVNTNPRFVQIDSIPKRLQLNQNCILIARSGSLGLVNTVSDEVLNCLLSSHIFKVELQTNSVLPSYAECLLRSRIGQLQFNQRNSGAVIPEISQIALQKLLLPLPPLDIQERIATEARARRERAKALE